MPKNQTASYGLNDRQRYTRVAGLVVVVAIVVGGWLWWSKVYESPSNVFWGMVSNNFATSSFTKQVTQNISGASLTQDIQMNLGVSNTAHAYSTISQTGNIVKTEEINTPSQDFVRYISITTDQKSSSGKPLNFKPILNIWGGTTPTQSPDSGELFDQTILGIFPIGSVTSSQRASLKQLIRDKDVYSVNFSDVQHQTVNGRSLDIYDVKVKPEAYIELLQAFAKDTGITSLSSIKPATYANDPSISFSVSVDILSRDLTGIIYPDNSQTEAYGGYGLAQQPLALPTKNISLTSLQSKLQAIK